MIGGRKLSKAEEKDLKSNSKMKRLSAIEIPQDHKYSVNMPLQNVLKFDNMLSSKCESQIKYKYGTNELTSVFVHLLYLKKFSSVPDEFTKIEDKEMILDITHPFPKTIEHFLEAGKDGSESFNQKCHHKASAEIKRNSYYGLNYQSKQYNNQFQMQDQLGTAKTIRVGKAQIVDTSYSDLRALALLINSINYFHESKIFFLCLTSTKQAAFNSYL